MARKGTYKVRRIVSAEDNGPERYAITLECGHVQRIGRMWASAGETDEQRVADVQEWIGRRTNCYRCGTFGEFVGVHSPPSPQAREVAR